MESIEQLGEWLVEKGVDTSGWGTGNAKNIGNLWDELVAGDIAIEEDSPYRVVNVAQVFIRRGERLLLEAEQELDSGQRRFRRQPPSEKMKRGESYLDASLRCLEEELDVDRKDVSFVPASYQQTSIVTDSFSYPGLATRYTFHTIGAEVNGLPDSDFWRENKAYGDGDPIKRHLWTWHTGEPSSPGARE